MSNTIMIGNSAVGVTDEQLEAVLAIIKPKRWEPKEGPYAITVDGRVVPTNALGDYNKAGYQHAGRLRTSHSAAIKAAERAKKRDLLDAWISENDPGHDMHGPGLAIYKVSAGEYGCTKSKYPFLFDFTVSGEAIARKLIAALISGEVVL